MGLADANEGRSCGRVTIGAVGSEGFIHIHRIGLDRVAVIMVVSVEVGAMTIGTGTTIATVNPGIAIAAYPQDQRTIDRGMTQEAVAFMELLAVDHLTRVAGDTEAGRGDGQAMVVTMARRIRVNFAVGIGKVVCPMTGGTR